MKRVAAGTAGFALIFLLLVAAPAGAQAPLESSPIHPPQVGFVSAYEVARTVRSAGFDPLAPPLREGTIYVVRATDFRGVLMRVVVDAHTGVIRDAARIISASEAGLPPPPPRPLPYGMATAPYELPPPPPRAPPPYGMAAAPYEALPPDVGSVHVMPPVEADEGPDFAPPSTGHPGPHFSNPPVPLPRPRPSLAERSDDAAKIAPTPDTSVKLPETVVPTPPAASGSPPQPGPAVTRQPDEKRDPASAPATNAAPGAASKPVRPAPPVIND